MKIIHTRYKFYNLKLKGATAVWPSILTSIVTRLVTFKVPFLICNKLFNKCPRPTVFFFFEIKTKELYCDIFFNQLFSKINTLYILHLIDLNCVAKRVLFFGVNFRFMSSQTSLTVLKAKVQLRPAPLAT